MDSDLLTTREVEQMIQINRVTIYRLIRESGFPAVRVGSQWRFPREAVENWLRQQDASRLELESLSHEEPLPLLVTPEIERMLHLCCEHCGLRLQLRDGLYPEAGLPDLLFSLPVPALGMRLQAFLCKPEQRFTEEQVALLGRLFATLLEDLARLVAEKRQLEARLDEIAWLVATRRGAPPLGD